MTNDDRGRAEAMVLCSMGLLFFRGLGGGGLR
jgi:hypothetical protein